MVLGRCEESGGVVLGRCEESGVRGEESGSDAGERRREEWAAEGGGEWERVLGRCEESGVRRGGWCWGGMRRVGEGAGEV